MRRSLLVVTAVLLPVLTASCLNPQVVNQTTSNLYPSAPGDEPFLLVRLINDTTATLDVPVQYDDGTGTKSFLFRDVTPDAREAGVLLDWPVTSVNVGNLQSGILPAIVASFPDGTNVVIPSNLLPAQASVDFQRGDALIYRFVADTRNPMAIGVTLAKIDGTTQQGPFSRADTFRTVRQVLELNGLAVGGTSSTTTTGSGT